MCTRLTASGTKEQQGNGHGNTPFRCVADAIEKKDGYFIHGSEHGYK